VLIALVAAASGLASPTRLSEKRGLETQLLRAVNIFRISRGLPALRVNPALSAAAGEHSVEMLQVGYFAHDGPSGSYASRIAQYYPARGRRRWRVGENLVWGAPSISAGEALSLWLRSPKHRANLLSRSWHEMGLSAVHGTDAPGAFQGLEVTVITLDFGRR